MTYPPTEDSLLANLELRHTLGHNPFAKSFPMHWERCDDCPKDAQREDDCYPCPLVSEEVDS